MKIAVAGATGRLGRHVAEVLAERGHEVVAIARATGVDIITGAGLEEALKGAEVIVDAATSPSPEQQAATDFFVMTAHNLQEAGGRAGVKRAVVVSIIGTGKFTGGYGAAKIAHEAAWQSGPVPVCIVRAAQFHEFVAQLLDWGTQGDVAYVPGMRTQIISARIVAEVIADVATSADDWAEVVEVAGPREEDLVALATLLAGRRGTPTKVQGVRSPADPDAELQATGGLLPGPGARLAGPTFEEWLGQLSSTGQRRWSGPSGAGHAASAKVALSCDAGESGRPPLRDRLEAHFTAASAPAESNTVRSAVPAAGNNGIQDRGD